MGASDAINSLRSEAVAKSSLINAVSDQIGTVSSDLQRVSGLVTSTKQAAEGLYNNQLSKLDGARRQLGQGVKGLVDEAIGIIFSMINAAMGGGGSAMNMAADLISMGITMKEMSLDIKQRDRTWDAAIITGNYVQLYSPGLNGSFIRM